MDDAGAQQPRSAGFRDAAATLAEVEVSASAAPLLEFFGADGVSVSTLGTLLSAETVSATSDLAARLDEWQFDLGEGPCWDAVATRQPILTADFSRESALWPAFRQAAAGDEIGSLAAFPLLLGSWGIGAIDFYTREPRGLEAQKTSEMMDLAAIVTRRVLRRALQDVGDAGSAGEDDSQYSRRRIHQATGMVLAQLGITAADAALLLQGRAFSEGRTVREVADSILAGRIVFTTDSNGIEDTQ